MNPIAPLTARALSAADPRDVTALQALIEDSAYYDVLPEAREHCPMESISLLTRLPDGATPDRKLVTGYFLGDELVGFSELLREPAEPGVAELALIVFRSRFVGMGLGPLAMQQVREHCWSWNCEHLAVRVPDRNSRAAAFFAREGFQPADHAGDGRVAALRHWVSPWLCELPGGRRAPLAKAGALH